MGFENPEICMPPTDNKKVPDKNCNFCQTMEECEKRRNKKKRNEQINAEKQGEGRNQRRKRKKS